MRTEVLERRAQVKAAFQMPYKVGDILHHSWGYEQTNCDFYEVVAVKGQSVSLRKIAHRQVSGGGGAAMSAMVMPILGQYVDTSNNAIEKHEARGRDPDKVIVKRVQAHFNGSQLRYFVSTPYGFCSLWDGAPCYESWYA